MARCKYKEHPRYAVVCVRVSEEERETLERLSLECNKKLSDLLREALQSMVPPANVPELDRQPRAHPPL